MKSEKCCENYRDWGLLVVRILIGVLFVVMGYNKLINIEGTAAFISSTWLPFPVVMAWATAILELLGGLAIILGIHQNGVALLMAVFLFVVALTFHFKLSDSSQITQLLKDLAIVGGLLSIFLCGGGKYRLIKCKCCPDCACCKVK